MMRGILLVLIGALAATALKAEEDDRYRLPLGDLSLKGDLPC